MPITSQPAVFNGHMFFTRKILASFIDFFTKRIYVERYDINGQILKYIRPPIHYANRERFISLVGGSNQVDHINTEAELDLNYILPRMSVNIVSMMYAPERKLNRRQKMRAAEYNDAGHIGTVLAPVPYTLDIELSILTKSIDDTFQIIEQIIPYFAPTFSLNVKSLEDFESESIQFTLNNVTPDAAEEYGIIDERIFTSSLNFQANVNYYYIKRNSKIIKEILAQYYVGKDDSYEKIKTYELTPNNLTPIKTVAERDEEPITTTITEP